MVKRYNQCPGLDYKETFSLVVKQATIRTILYIAMMQGWSLRQLEVNNAFLHGTLTEDVYISQPPGFKDSQYPDHVRRLREATYGLKQAHQSWYSTLKEALLSFGYINFKEDTSLFIYHS